MTILDVEASDFRWYPNEGDPRGPVRVELSRLTGISFTPADTDPLAWVRSMTVTLDPERSFVMIEIMGLTFRLLKLPDDARTVLDRCPVCDRAVLRRRGEEDYKHIGEEGHYVKCYPDDPESSDVAAPTELGGMVLVDVPTEETSTAVPLRETHAGQYVVMPSW
jgi:hypothetical protein